MYKILVFDTIEQLKTAERKSRKEGKPFPKIVIIEAKWRIHYKKMMKLMIDFLHASRHLLEYF